MTAREANCDNLIYLALGTNLGDREANLREALRRIASLGLAITRRSSIYETEPVGFADQGWFLNQAIEARMSRELTFDSDAGLTLTDQLVRLLGALLRIEDEMGRRRVMADGPRVIDIDVLLCGNITGTFGGAPLPELILPHPRLHLRRFVLAPLCEIAPRAVHPALQKSVRELLAALDDPAAVRLYKRGEP